MKLYANHTIHRRLKESGPEALPEVIEAGRVFDATKEELQTFQDLQRKGGAGATLAAREATPGEIADDEARVERESGVMTVVDDDGMPAAATTADINAKSDFDAKVAAERAKSESKAAPRAAAASKTSGKTDEI